MTTSYLNQVEVRGGFGGAPKVYLEDDADPFIVTHAMHWLVCIESYSPNRKSTIGHYWDLDYGTPETCVYKLRCNPNRMIIGFRGTDNTKDLYDDYKITMAQVFPRVAEAVVLVRGILERNPDARIVVAGHSLGGAIAHHVGHELGLLVVTFNAAAPPTAPITCTSNEVNYHIVFDIISAWQSPFTIRIDKGYYPIARWWETAITAIWIYASLNDIIKSHGLNNFSNEKAGKIICGEEETQLFRKWILSLPFRLRIFVRITLFGIKGSAELPPITGCFKEAHYDGFN